MMNKHIFELLLFCVAGIIGFIVDSGVLYLLMDYAGLYLSRLVSFFCAVLITWLFNKNLTFNSCSSGHSLFGEFFRYLTLMGVGGLVNLLSYMISVHSLGIISSYPVFGVAIGSVFGMIFNYASSKFLLFKNSSV